MWTNDTEIQFFRDALKIATPDKLFYRLNEIYYAFVPKKISGLGATLQSRNSHIGNFAEKWAKDFFTPIAGKFGLHAVNTMRCDALGLTAKSEADLAFCTTEAKIQKPQNIKLIFEIKMSVVSNYQYIAPDTINYVGDYNSHKGIPALLRSDSMLKAAGKAIYLRSSCDEATAIPILILCNSPITKGYAHKVDSLGHTGVVQGFWSLNPNPSESKHSDYVTQTTGGGFVTFSSAEEVEKSIEKLLQDEKVFFASRIPKSKLGEIIRIASAEKADVAKAEKFLSLIRSIK